MRLAALRTDTCPILQHCFRKSWQETVPLHGIFRGTLLTTRDDGGNRVAGEKSHPQQLEGSAKLRVFNQNIFVRIMETRTRV